MLKNAGDKLRLSSFCRLCIWVGTLILSTFLNARQHCLCNIIKCILFIKKDYIFVSDKTMQSVATCHLLLINKQKIYQQKDKIEIFQVPMTLKHFLTIFLEEAKPFVSSLLIYLFVNNYLRKKMWATAY